MGKAKKGKPSRTGRKVENLNSGEDKQKDAAELAVKGEKMLADIAEELQDVDLLGRVRDIETQIDEAEPEVGFEDVQQEGGFFSVVRDLEEEIDATLALKDSLETDLEAAREKLSQESSARSELETRVKLLESQAALAEQLRQELSFVEEERDRASSVLTETRSELDSVTDERNSLTESFATAEAQSRRLDTEKSDLETHVSGLNGRIAELELLASDLDKASRERDVLEEKVKDLRRSLETSDSMVDTLKSDLSTSRDLVRDLRTQIENGREQIDDLKAGFATSSSDLTEARTELDAHVEVNKHLGEQVKALTGKYRVTFAELEMAKKALRSLQKTALRVRERTGRTRRRPGA